MDPLGAGENLKADFPAAGFDLGGRRGGRDGYSAGQVTGGDECGSGIGAGLGTPFGFRPRCGANMMRSSWQPQIPA